MHEYIPPPFPDRLNAVNSTDALPARIIDFRLWVARLTALKARSEENGWETGDNPYLKTSWLQERLKLYGRRAKAEMELLGSDSRSKHWQSGELPGNLK